MGWRDRTLRLSRVYHKIQQSGRFGQSCGLCRWHTTSGYHQGIGGSCDQGHQWRCPDEGHRIYFAELWRWRFVDVHWSQYSSEKWWECFVLVGWPWLLEPIVWRLSDQKGDIVCPWCGIAFGEAGWTELEAVIPWRVFEVQKGSWQTPLVVADSLWFEVVVEFDWKSSGVADLWSWQCYQGRASFLVWRSSLVVEIAFYESGFDRWSFRCCESTSYFEWCQPRPVSI